MLHRFPARSAVLLALLTAASCEPSHSLGPAERTPALEARLIARGAPIVIQDRIDVTGTIPAGFFCPDVAVEAHSVGYFVTKIWTAGEIFLDETLVKSEGRVDNTFTHPVTGKSVTSHQAGTQESVIEGFEFIEFTSSGSPTRVVIPGEGLLEYFIGHLKISVDITTTPPTVTSEFHGIESSGDLCALIS